MPQFKYDIDEYTNDLLKDAAKRVKQSKQKFIESVIDHAAGKEYAKQQKDSANGNNLG